MAVQKAVVVKNNTTCDMQPGDILDGADDGRCRLTMPSNTGLLLSPWEGSALAVGGVAQQVPAAGVTLSNANLAANSLLYVYAILSNGALALYPSALGYVRDGFGRAVINIDGKGTPNSNYRLVGMVATDANSKFTDVASFFFRRDVTLTSSASGGSTSSTTPVEYSNLRVSTLVWGDEIVRQKIVGYGYNTTAGYNAVCSAYLSGNPQGPQGVMSGTAAQDCSTAFDFPLTEGFNPVGVCISTNGGAANFTLSHQVTTRK